MIHLQKGELCSLSTSSVKLLKIHFPVERYANLRLSLTLNDSLQTPTCGNSISRQ